jgi:2-succinyl-6-hydroxy-2,4-cyclohexadiene-1-carboxylate synthase
MGGRMALHVALAYPDLVERLVLISATPGIKDEAERSARRQADKALAAGLQSGGLARFLSKWLAQPMFATLSPQQADLGSRMANSPAGLASSLLLAGTGAQEPLWPRLAELAGKDVLLLSGERDEKFCDVARRMAAAMGPRARHVVVAGAGHACHLEHPREVAATIADFCAART